MERAACGGCRIGFIYRNTNIFHITNTIDWSAHSRSGESLPRLRFQVPLKDNADGSPSGFFPHTSERSHPQAQKHYLSYPAIKANTLCIGFLDLPYIFRLFFQIHGFAVIFETVPLKHRKLFKLKLTIHTIS